MLQSLLTHIKENLLTLNPNTFQKGYAGARQYQDGKIVIYENSEGKYVGLKDNDNNYFYIRYLNTIDIDIAPSDDRTTSCTELQGTAAVRLVAWVKRADFTKLIEVLLNDIASTDFSTMSAANRETFSDIKLAWNQILTDPEQIYKEETGNDDPEEVRGAKDVTLIAIDFGILFNYKMKANDCIDRDICVGCAA